MILYNVTVNVDADVEQEWIDWMKSEHIPEVLATGCFATHKFLKLMHEDPEATGSTYAVQYFTKEVRLFNKYQDEFAPALQKKHFQKFNEKCVAFRTLLEEV